jgi:S1-C subfamily serine protease
VKLELLRAGQPVTVSATLTTRPSTEALQAMHGGVRVDALGVVLKPLNEEAAKGLGVEPGLRVEFVLPGGAAELAGVMAGDVVLEVNRIRVSTLPELEAALSGYESTEPVLLKFRRGTSLRYVALKPRT